MGDSDACTTTQKRVSRGYTWIRLLLSGRERARHVQSCASHAGWGPTRG